MYTGVPRDNLWLRRRGAGGMAKEATQTLPGCGYVGGAWARHSSSGCGYIARGLQPLAEGGAIRSLNAGGGVCGARTIGAVELLPYTQKRSGGGVCLLDDPLTIQHRFGSTAYKMECKLSLAAQLPSHSPKNYYFGEIPWCIFHLRMVWTFVLITASNEESPGDLSRLNQGVAICEEKLNQCPTGEIRRCAVLADLAIALFNRFASLGSINDLQLAETYQRQAIETCPIESPQHISLLGNLAAILTTRFNQLGQMENLDEAIKILGKVIIQLPRGHANHSAALSNLANSLCTRFRQEGNLEDVDTAIQLNREALALQPESPNRAGPLNNLALAIRERFGQQGNVEDIGEAIQLHREALALRPVPHPNRASSLNNLAGAIHERFRQQGNAEDINEAIRLHTEALSLRPGPHPDRASSLNNLAVAIKERFGQRGNAEDIEQAVQLHREVLGIRPAPHPDRSSALSNLAVAIHERFVRGGNVEDINEAVQLHREALALRPVLHPDRASSLNNLAGAIHGRFRQRGNVEDIDEAIQLHREALALQPGPHPDRASSLRNLAVAIQGRFGQQGNSEDINEAIQLHREALSLQPAPHPGRATSLNNLAGAIHERFWERENAEDIEEVVQLHQEALSLRPVPHPNRANSLTNLASAIHELFVLRGNVEDINDAIQLHQEALALRPAPHPSRARCLNNLAVAIWERFTHRGNVEDIDEAVQLHREALALRPGPHPDRASSLSNLAVAVRERFGQQGNTEDINESVQLHREALALRPEPHPDRANSHINLGSCLVALHTHTHTPQSVHLTDAILAFQEATFSPCNSPLDQFRAAKAWAQVAHENHHTSTMQAYVTAIGLLAQLAAFDRDLQSRQTILISRGDNLGSDAAAFAVELGQHKVAIELLEAGRSVFWAQSLHLRTPLDDLRSAHPHLASKLAELSQQLQQSSFRDTTRNFQSDTHHKVISMEAEGWKCRQLNDEWNQTVESVRSSVPGFEDFMQPKGIVKLQQAAKHGPVVVLNAGRSSCHALIVHFSGKVDCVLLPELRTRNFVNYLAQIVQAISSATFHSFLATSLNRGFDSDSTDRLIGKLVYEKSQSPTDWFQAVLAILWIHLVNPVIQHLKLQNMVVSNRALHLPAHPRRRNIPPRINELLEGIAEDSRKDSAGMADTLGTLEFPASVNTVLPNLQNSSIFHFAGHGVQDTNKPLQSALLIDSDKLTVSKIMEKSGFSHDGPETNGRDMGLAFLSACQTAMGDQKVPDEAMHLAATLLFTGFRSVVATMWTIHDPDGPEIAEVFYGHLFRNVDPISSPPVFPDLNESAEALHLALAKLRIQVPLLRWVPFVHYGL
ncbi:CHAT domain-containing protein [Mycena rosella]|uniref:CHAT domain-containing protein n=1 Tax=Mycena rosella TaxID=1033263 RepID=A0AAD7G262_MYCRO|nr:CHAT domain-containing protein [Mycena rosella]